PVQRPRREGRLLEGLHRRGALLVALLLQALGQGVAGGGELLQRQAVELVDLVVVLVTHSCSLAPARRLRRLLGRRSFAGGLLRRRSLPAPALRRTASLLG